MVNGKEYGADKAVLTIITDENGIAASAGENGAETADNAESSKE